MRENEHDLIGIGLYTVPEVALLTGAPSRSIRRWVRGYTYSRSGVSHDRPPVWRPQIEETDSTVGLGFLDLMEVRFVNAFREHRVPWWVIHLAARRAREWFHQDHPFSRRRFLTDGRRIFVEVIEESGEPKLLDLVRSQYAFYKIVSPSLYASVEFSDRDEALRWFPMWPKRQIVIDPQRAFGRPIVAREGVPTATLAKAAAVEDTPDSVAKWFDVSTQSVHSAVAFERELGA